MLILLRYKVVALLEQQNGMDKPVLNESSSIELKAMAEYGTRAAQPAGVDAAEKKREEDDIDGLELQRPEEVQEDEEGKGKEKKGQIKKKAREVWDNKVQFILTLVGYAVGLGNVWRFSYLTAKNGGSAFIIPYLVMLFLLGIPLFYLELLLGQSLRKGPILVWHKILPNFTGVGIASVVVIVYICLYYNVIISWVLFYLVNSFHLPLPWDKCFGHDVTDSNLTDILVNFTGNVDNLMRCYNESTEYYWYNTAVRASSDIGTAGAFNWQMFLCLMAAWILMYVCLFRGIESSGKIVYFTATFPYLILLCLFFRAVTLEGAGDGLRFLFLPDSSFKWEKLVDPQVWLEASTQIFFSLGVATGALIALSSYTKPHYNALTDSFIVCITNSLTSLFSSIVVFSVIGFQARRANIDLGEQMVTEGPGLAFVIFTEALIYMPVAPLWAVLFFIMLLLLGIDSQFATLEGLITVLRDNKYLKKLRKELLVAIICALMFLVSFPFILGNGLYLFQLWDQYCATIPLLIIGLFEFIAIGWVYGVKNFFTQVTVKPVHPRMIMVWRVLWVYVNPIVMTIIFIGAIAKELANPLTYVAYQDGVEERVPYPSWAQFIGSVIVLTSVLAMPIYLIVRLIFFESGRQEALRFLREKITEGEELIGKVKKLPSRTVHFFRSIHLRRRAWEPHRDQDSDDTVPYSPANGTVLNSFRTQAEVPSDS